MSKFKDKRKEFDAVLNEASFERYARTNPLNQGQIEFDGIDNHHAINSLEVPMIFNKINGYLSYVKENLYPDPVLPLTNIQQKLHLIGINLVVPAGSAFRMSNGTVRIPLTKWGGRFGMTPDEGWVNDSGFKPDMDLVCEYQMMDGLYALDCSIQPAVGRKAVNESLEENSGYLDSNDITLEGILSAMSDLVRDINVRDHLASDYMEAMAFAVDQNNPDEFWKYANQMIEFLDRNERMTYRQEQELERIKVALEQI